MENQTKKIEYRVWLREQRLLRGYNQIEFAKLINISRSALCQIETGISNPSPRIMREIKRAFNENEVVVPEGVELPALAAQA